MAEPSDRELEQLFALDSAAGPARPLDPARSAAIIAAALHGAGFPPPVTGGTGSSGGGSSGPPGAGHTARRAAFASKRLLLAGGASVITVAVIIGLVVRRPDTPDQTAPPQTASTQTAGAPSEPAPSPPAPAEPAPTEHPRSEPAADPPVATEAAPGESIRPPSTRSPAPAKPHVTPTPLHRRRLPPRTAAVAAVADPEDLLAEANAARLARNWRGADALYTRVAAAGGAALAAQTALVASAQLHLEHLGDPDGAARRFRRALSAGAHDTLAEEARWGLAEVARATHDTAAERLALDDFLGHHAASVRASQARARRAALGAAP